MVKLASIMVIAVAALSATDSVSAAGLKCRRRLAARHEGNCKKRVTSTAAVFPTATPEPPSYVELPKVVPTPALPAPKPVDSPKPISTPKPEPAKFVSVPTVPKPKPEPTPTPIPKPEPKPVPKGSFQDDCLATHNRLRAQDGKGALVWSAKAAAHAQNWANTLAASGKFDLEHSGGPFGENLFASSTSGDENQACGPAVQSWYDEKSLMPKSGLIGDGDFHAYGHYSQVVWGTTKELGCALGVNDGTGQKLSFVVCEYFPAGNFVGQPIP
ncbi:uncharacterized protein SPPG_07190 [Spizellomyces punctatus DAOM BR117]|uniref:SCP domain-containing protein n=1 Tax=Spizellomyces punctatus (strain DAOM BR117) TaxID=645134 RepID=A0A0L0HAK0_SPIPD|nr:uncharacterized protein SPPG_07190 [Spizellomyces punctatus DAOM BR117]KNC97728.1 hypothetical protein SPPG_07190 [Spizellomyces punctatus DAOM BR117]|eukprot:XP_016605768.1 hypothetical protein SPPG_07190 [Spizellomyces punctatus DAOM BR117]